MSILDFYRFMTDNELKSIYKEIKENKIIHPDGATTTQELQAIEEVAKERNINL